VTRFWLGRSGARRLLIRQQPRRPGELFPPKRTTVRCLRGVFLEGERKFHQKKSQNRSGSRATNHQQRFIKKWHLSVSANTVSIFNFEGMNENNQNTSDSDDQLWKTERVAKYLHVSPKTIFNLRKRGLPYVQLGGAVRFVPQEIRDYLVNSRTLSLHRLRQIARKGAMHD